MFTNTENNKTDLFNISHLRKQDRTPGYFDVRKIFKKIVNKVDASWYSPLREAALFGDIATVKALLNTTRGKQSLTVATSSTGDTPLHLAVANNHSDVVKIFLGYDEVDVNKQDRQGRTAVYIASYYGYSHILKLLIDKNAKTDTNIKIF